MARHCSALGLKTLIPYRRCGGTTIVSSKTLRNRLYLSSALGVPRTSQSNPPRRLLRKMEPIGFATDYTMSGF